MRDHLDDYLRSDDATREHYRSNFTVNVDGALVDVRSVPGELRASRPGQPPRLEGYAAVFGSLSEELFPGLRERVHAGAFKKTLREKADVRAYWQHKREWILGSSRNETVEVREDSKGLAFTIYPPDTPTVHDLVLAPIRRGDVRGASFGFQTVRDGLSRESDFDVRELFEVKLHHIAPVDDPAYPATQVSARSLVAAWAEDHGLTREPEEGTVTPELWAMRNRRLRLELLDREG